MGYQPLNEFNLTAGDIVTEAFGLLGVLAESEPLTASMFQDGIRAINLIVKQWQTQGYHLWKENEGTLFLTPGVNQYALGNDAPYCTFSEDWISTQLTSNTVVSQTSIIVQSTTGMSIGDVVGVQLASTYRQWSAIASVDSSTQITIVDPLTQASQAGYSVFTYTNPLDRPSRVLTMRRSTYYANQTPQQITEVTVQKVSSQVYFNQTLKYANGAVSLFYYRPSIGTNGNNQNGTMFLWLTGNTVNDYVNFTYESYIDNIALTTDNIEIPQEWQMCLIYATAEYLLGKYPSPASSYIISKAQQLVDNALAFDNELADVNIYFGRY
jgi:hypothetical protein